MNKNWKGKETTYGIRLCLSHLFDWDCRDYRGGFATILKIGIWPTCVFRLLLQKGPSPPWIYAVEEIRNITLNRYWIWTAFVMKISESFVSFLNGIEHRMYAFLNYINTMSAKCGHIVFSTMVLTTSERLFIGICFDIRYTDSVVPVRGTCGESRFECGWFICLIKAVWGCK